jgi:ABC-type uncharacterized transport system auxiliary subunit
MFRLIVGLFLAATISGCAAPQRAPVEVVEPSSSYNATQAVPLPVR